MNCEEFLRQFRDALDGKVSENLIQDNINYYRSYINSQTTAGRSEADVLRALGDPRLLAKTIEESSKFASENREQWNKAGASGSASRMTEDAYETADDSKHRRLPGWLVTCLVVLVILLVLSVVFRVFVFLTPYIIFFMLTGFVIRAVRSWWQNR